MYKYVWYLVVLDVDDTYLYKYKWQFGLRYWSNSR